MDTNKWMLALSQFLILIPAAVSCYLPLKNQMKYTITKTTTMCISVIVPYSLVSAWLYTALKVDINTILLPSLFLFFFLYRQTIKIDLSRSLAIYVGVCAIETFPSQFASSFDSIIHPLSGAGNFSFEASLFQISFSFLLLAAFAYPANRYFYWVIDNVDIPKIWYSTVVLSSAFLIFNIISVPQSYTTLHTGRMGFLFPAFEACALVLLVSIYILFYQGARLILEHAKLKEHSQLLEMQSRQYSMLQEHMNQTSRLRHDFRHSLRIITSLAEKNDTESIRTHLAEYEIRLSENILLNYCNNAALNALFGYYHEMAVNANIDIDWNIEISELINISELDMAALFGNIIENAIAGCLGVSEDSRYFCLTTEVRNDNRLYIVSTNSFDGKVRKKNDTYYSTKHSGKGTGLTSIAVIAEKYNGSARISNNDKEFFVDVVIKI